MLTITGAALVASTSVGSGICSRATGKNTHWSEITVSGPWS